MKLALRGAILSTVVVTAGCVDGDVNTSLESRSPTRLSTPTVATVPELSIAQLTLDDDITEVAPVREHRAITVTFSGRTLNLTARELTNPVMVVVDVYHRRGDETIIRPVEVLGVNTSAQRSEAIGYDVTERHEDLLALAEDKSVHDYFVDLAFLNRTIEPDVRDRLVSYFDATTSGHHATLKIQMDDLRQTFDAYLSGHLDERSLSESAAAVEVTLAAHGEHGTERLQTIESLMTPFIDPLPNTSLVFDEAAGRFSRFYHPDMVTKDSETGEYAYRAGFTMLTPLIFR